MTFTKYSASDLNVVLFGLFPNTVGANRTKGSVIQPQYFESEQAIILPPATDHNDTHYSQLDAIEDIFVQAKLTCEKVAGKIILMPLSEQNLRFPSISSTFNTLNILPNALTDMVASKYRELMQRDHWVTLCYDPRTNIAQLIDSRSEFMSFGYSTDSAKNKFLTALKQLNITPREFKVEYQSVQHDTEHCGDWVIHNIEQSASGKQFDELMNHISDVNEDDKLIKKNHRLYEDILPSFRQTFYPHEYPLSVNLDHTSSTETILSTTEALSAIFSEEAVSSETSLSTDTDILAEESGTDETSSSTDSGVLAEESETDETSSSTDSTDFEEENATDEASPSTDTNVLEEENETGATSLSTNDPIRIKNNTLTEKSNSLEIKPASKESRNKDTKEEKKETTITLSIAPPSEVSYNFYLLAISASATLALLSLGVAAVAVIGFNTSVMSGVVVTANTVSVISALTAFGLYQLTPSPECDDASDCRVGSPTP